MKKITSVLLTVVMLVSMLSVTASAASGGTCVEANASVNYSNRIVTVAFTAAQSTTNGKIMVEYDSNSLTYLDCTVNGTVSSVSPADGAVAFGYGTSTSDAIRTRGSVATLTLRISPNASGTAFLRVSVEEFNGTAVPVESFTLAVDLDEPYDPPVFPTTPGGSTGGATKPAETPPAETPPVEPSTPSDSEALPVTTRDEAEEEAVVTVTKATIESTTEGGTASASVSQEIADEIVSQAVRNGSDTVVIAPDMSGDVTKTEVTLPAGLVAGVANQTGADLRVETPVAHVTIPQEGLSGLAASGGDVSVTAERSGNSVAVTISANNQPVGRVSGGVTVSVPQPNCTPSTVAMLVRADGTTEVIRMSVASSDGQSITIPLDGSATVMIVDNSVSLSDVPSAHWASGAVAFATSHELMQGTGGGVFQPDALMTRGMLATVLHNLVYNAAAGGAVSFSDVADSVWYAGAVEWAASKQIITGYPDGRFGPNDSITREQLAVMLYRFAGSPAAGAGALNFTDADKISSYAQQAMAWAVANGVLNGKGNGVLDPQGTATRAEVAQMLLNFVSGMA